MRGASLGLAITLAGLECMPRGQPQTKAGPNPGGDQMGKRWSKTGT